jgi:hypothetical protein
MSLEPAGARGGVEGLIAGIDRTLSEWVAIHGHSHPAL